MEIDYTQEFFGYFVPKDAPFYVYLLLRPSGIPFYVGKGCGNRINDHEKEAKRKHDCHKCRVIRKIWRSGGDVGKQVIFATHNEQEAYRIEALTIQRFASRIVNYYDRDNRLVEPLTQRPRRLTSKQRKAQAEARESKVIKLMSQLERRLKYTNLTGDLEERARLKEEIEWLDLELWPPRQLKLTTE